MTMGTFIVGFTILLLFAAAAVVSAVPFLHFCIS